jgi:alcohol dehydrogenase (cytochrome c)
MTKTIKLFLATSLLFLPALFLGQGLDPASILKPAINSWPTYAGDYSQQRYSLLTQIGRSNAHTLTLAWVSPLTAGPEAGGNDYPTTIGGIAKNPVTIPGSSSGPPRLAGSILQVNGILYISSPDNAWAMDAVDGRLLWHYWWKSRGATHIGNRGMAMYHDWLYFETPDDYLVSLDAKNGKERWHKEIADFNQQYFSTTAPVVVGNHLLVGTGDDLDSPGFLQSFDPVTALHRAHEEGRSRMGHLAQHGRGKTRRRPGLDAGLLRSGNPPLHFRHRESHPGLHGQNPRPQNLHQSFYLRDCRGECGHGQDGLVLPDFAR